MIASPTKPPKVTVPISHYLLAVSLSLAAVVVRMALNPWLDSDRFSFLLMVVTCGAVGVYVGLGPSLLGLAIGALATSYLILPPSFSFLMDKPHSVAGLVLFFITALICGLTIVQIRRNRLGKQAGNALAALRSQELHQTLESITDSFFSLDSRWNFTFVNSQAAERFQTDVLGKNIWAVFPDAVGNQAFVELHRAMADQVAVEYEVFYAAWQRWFRDKAYPIADGGLAVYSLDITEFKHQAEALATSQAEAERRLTEFEAIYAALPIGICVLDHGLRFRRVNASLAGTNGIAAEAHIGKTVHEVMPALADRSDAMMRRVLQSGETVRFEMRDEAPAQPGETRICDVQWFALHAPASNEIVGVCGVMQEITQRKQAEEVLYARTQQLESLLTSAPIGVAFFDRDHRYLRINDELAAINGIPAADHLGHKLGELLPGIGSVIGPVIDTVFHNRQPVRSETAGETPREPGVQRHWMTGFYPVFGPTGEVAMAGCWVVEISERKRAEEALQGSKQRLQLAMSIARAGTWDQDMVNDVSHWSESHFTLLGYPAAPDGVAAASMWQGLILPEDLPRVQAEWQQAQSTRSMYQSEHRLRRADNGAVIWIKAAGRFFYDHAGKPVRSVGAFFDVTALKETEQALIDADRRKDDFLATLAHELRNPLAPMRSSLHILRHGESAPADTKRLLDIMERQLSHMVQLVDDLLEVSRIASGKINLRLAPIDLRAAVYNALELAGPLIDAAGHRLSIHLPDAPVPLSADANRLAQVFANLLTNAAKYTEHGGLIQVHLHAENQVATFAVRDSGLGIPAEMLPRVFDLFTQVDRTLGRAQGGLGIGLSLVKSLVELHGGTVIASSGGAGKGSEFVVRLPLENMQSFQAPLSTAPVGKAAAQPNARPEAPSPAEPAKELALLRILVVDDNQDAAESLAMLLELLGASVRTVFSGLDALAALRVELPHLIFLDLGMPEMDGYAVARRIRAEPSWNVKIVALTGWGQSEDRKRTHEAGFDRHCVKPIDIKQLTGLLAELVPGDGS